MKRGPCFLFLLLFLVTGSLVGAYDVGVDYPDYRISHGYEYGPFDKWIELDDDYTKRPVLLIHGWGNGEKDLSESPREHSNWGDVEDELIDAGHELWRLEYWPANLSNRKNAGMIGQAIDEILDKGYREEGITNVDVVAHSMGNLGTLGYINNLGISRDGAQWPYQDDIRKHIAIAGPTQGSYFANILDGATPIDILGNHPDCQDFIEGINNGLGGFYSTGVSLAGGSEATLDMQIGSDFLWELNRLDYGKEVDRLAIVGELTGDGISQITSRMRYCVGNGLEINDGIVSAIDSNYLKYGSPLIIINEFHSSAPTLSINTDADVGVLASYFLSDTLDPSTADERLRLTGTPLEYYYNPQTGEGALPDELKEKGSVVIEVHKSEIDLRGNSASLNDGEYSLEMNPNTGRYYYVDVNEVPGEEIDFTTMVSEGSYDLTINEYLTGKDVAVYGGMVNFVVIDLDGDSDGFDIDYLLSGGPGSDCDDSRNLTFPGAFEACNLIDDNCEAGIEDDGINESWYNESTSCGIGACRNYGAYLCLSGEKEDICEPFEPSEEPRYADKDYNCDGLVGLLEYANENLSLDFERINNSFSFIEGDRKIIDFEFDVSNESVNVVNMIIDKQGENESFAYLVVRGLELSSHNQTKTIYLDRILNGTGICIKDGDVESIENVSSSCDGENEIWIGCPGESEIYTCDILENSSRYKISGLRHSAVREQATYCGDAVCNGGESCSSCSQDCGGCPVDDGGGGGSGGGGGGGSSRNVKSSKINETNETMQEINPNGLSDVNDESNTGDFLNGSLNESEPAPITGAAIGAAFSRSILPLIIFALVIVVSFLFLYQLRRRLKVKKSTISGNIRENQEFRIDQRDCLSCGLSNPSWRRFCVGCGESLKG